MHLRLLGRSRFASTTPPLWVVAGDDLQGYRLHRIDPRTGEQTADVELGAHTRARSSPRATGCGSWAATGPPR